MRKRHLIGIILAAVVAVGILVAVVIGIIQYNESLIPEQKPAAPQTTEETTEVETESEFSFDALQSSEGLEYGLCEDGESYAVLGMGSCTDKNIVIPKTYDGKPVTRINDRAFAGSGIESIAFSKNIKSIGVSAFEGCKSLNIYFDGTNKEWLNDVEKADGWRTECSFKMNYIEPNDPTWEIPIT